MGSSNSHPGGSQTSICESSPDQMELRSAKQHLNMKTRHHSAISPAAVYNRRCHTPLSERQPKRYKEDVSFYPENTHKENNNNSVEPDGSPAETEIFLFDEFHLRDSCPDVLDQWPSPLRPDIGPQNTNPLRPGTPPPNTPPSQSPIHLSDSPPWPEPPSLGKSFFIGESQSLSPHSSLNSGVFSTSCSSFVWEVDDTESFANAVTSTPNKDNLHRYMDTDLSTSYETNSANEDKFPSKEDKNASIDNYDLLSVIGRGSYATIFLGERKSTKQTVAIKVLKEDQIRNATEAFVFLLAEKSSFLVGLDCWFQTRRRLFFVMEFVGGGDLESLLEKKLTLPEEHARFYSAEVCLAIDFLHQNGIVHRDIKPENILLDREGHVKLTDYGLSKQGIFEGDNTSSFCGTTDYMAPEVLRRDNYGASVDWWAVGILIHDIVAGDTPFTVRDNRLDKKRQRWLTIEAIIEKKVVVPRYFSSKAAAVVLAFLDRDPATRLGSQGGVLEIQEHCFFSSIDWDLLEQRKVPPPHRPMVESDRDTSNFPEVFTQEPPLLSPESPMLSSQPPIVSPESSRLSSVSSLLSPEPCSIIGVLSKESLKSSPESLQSNDFRNFDCEYH